MNKILLIDGNSLVYRAYFGSAYGPRGILTNSKDVPVNAILTFTRMFEKALRNYSPTHVFVAFDAGSHTNRHDKLSSYKAGRSKTPQELLIQMPLIKKMLSFMNIKHFELAGIEADDIVGTFAHKFADNDDVLILSSDKDLYQLVINRNVKMIVPQNGVKTDKIIDFETFNENFGYGPHQVPDIKAIVGDASDNLKGVGGIGPKGAVKLIEKFHTLESVYENMGKISPKIQEKLLKSKDMAFLCKELATIKIDVDVPFCLKDLEYKNNVSSDLIAFFEDLEITSLVKHFTSKKQNSKASEKIDFKNVIL